MRKVSRIAFLRGVAATLTVLPNCAIGADEKGTSGTITGFTLSPQTTDSYNNLVESNLWLKDARKSVCQLRMVIANKSFPYGSAVLLDSEGTIVLCGHEAINGSNQEIEAVFSPAINESVAYKCSTFKCDPRHDIAFATLTPAIISTDGPLPVVMGATGLLEANRGKEIIDLGWPGGASRLHTTKGKILAFREEYTMTDFGIYDDVMLCKMVAAASARKGMSGCGIFIDQKLIGILNSCAPDDQAVLTFTPIDFIREAYISLFPDRARRAGVALPDVGSDINVPNACRANVREFSYKQTQLLPPAV